MMVWHMLNLADKSKDRWLSLVEGTGFENRRRGNSSGGSNPSLSAFSFLAFLAVHQLNASTAIFGPVLHVFDRMNWMSMIGAASCFII